MANRPTRRHLLAASSAALAAAQAQAPAQTAKPNIILVISDQFRWDCIGAMGLNPMNLTPNLDQMAGRGVMFRSAFCNQPVCAPARASIFTGQYPSRHGVWRNALGLQQGATTLATTLRQGGYSTNYIGKWHLAPGGAQAPPETRGPVPAIHRGGFDGLWEASNALELTSHAYEGDLYGADNQPIHFSGRYRADFMTDRAQNFLRSSAARSPFFLTLSYLEVHHQNDTDTYDPPNEFKNRYPNPYIPGDLHPLPGTWPSQLSDYYACVAKMDEIMGTLRRTLTETGHAANTVVAFTSDHACHFRSRNAEYKRSPHESSIHIPLIVEGPGFNRGIEIRELVSQVDLMPTFLQSASLPIPATVQGRSVLPLLDRRTEGWRDEVFFEMSEFFTGRGLRTPQYTYAAVVPKQPGWRDVAQADRYVEYMMYDNYADPHQHVNLAGRATHRTIAEGLRARLVARIREAGGPAVTIEPSWFPYS